jgi:hypothetical protein
MYIHYKLPTDVAPGITAAAHAFSATIQIPFITPMGARPVDTVLDMDAFQRLDINIQWGDENSLIYSGTKSFTTDPVVKVVAEVSRFDPPPTSFYKETGNDSSLLGTAANTDLNLEMVVGPRINYHHILLEAQDMVANTGRALVATAINNLQLQQSAAGEISYPFGRVSGAEIQYDFDTYYSRVNAIQTGMYPIPFQAEFEGRNTFNLMTAGLDDLRLLIDHAGFTTNGLFRSLVGTIEPIF